MKNYYNILEINSSATIEDVKTNFRRLAKLYHPDHSKNNSTVSKFIEITEAYEVLSDETKRQKYNSCLINPVYSDEAFSEVVNQWEIFGKQKADEYMKCWVCENSSSPDHSWIVQMGKKIINKDEGSDQIKTNTYAYVYLPLCKKCDGQLNKEQTRHKYLFYLLNIISYLISVSIFNFYENGILLSMILSVFVIAFAFSTFNKFIIIFATGAYIYVFYNLHWIISLLIGFISPMLLILLLDSIPFNGKKGSIRMKDTTQYKPVADLIKKGYKIIRS